MDSEDSKLFDSYVKQRLKAEKNGQLDNEAKFSHYIAYLHEKYGNFEEAVSEHKRAVRLLEALSNKIDIAVGYRTLGECYCKQKQYKKALHLHEKYWALAVECNDHVEQQRALTTIGNTYLEQSGDRNLSLKARQTVCRKSVEAYLKSLQICDKIKGTIDEKEYVDMRARNFYNLGLVYEGLEDSNKSKDYLKKAVTLSQSHSLLEVLYICQKALGDICLKEEDADNASTYFKNAMETAKKLKNKQQKIECLIAMAQVSVLQKNIPHSRHLLKKAHKLCQKNEDEKIKIHELYKAVVSMDTSTKSLQKTSLEDVPARIACYDKLGDCAVDLKLFKLAIKFYSKELSASVESGRSKKELIPIYISLAQTYCDFGQYEKAIGYYKKEIDCYEEEDFEQVCRSWLNIATYEEKCGKPYKAVQMSYVNAHNAAKKASNRRLQCRALSCLVDLFKVNNDEKLMKKSQEQLEHVKQKYNICDFEVEEESQGIDDDDDVVGDGLILPTDDDIEMSDLTESEDDEVVVKTVRTVHKHGRRQKEIKRNDFGETPLHRACIKGDLKKVKELVEDGHPVNVQDHSGWIPLHEAANNNWYDVTEYLLQHGADINHRGGEKCGGMTPLIDAASVGWLDIMEVLLKYGANAWAKDDHQLTALDHLIKLREDSDTELDRATEIKYNNIVGMLKEKNPAYRGTNRNKLLSQLKTTALVPESECPSTSTSCKINKTKFRSRNDIIVDSDSDHDSNSTSSQSRNSQQATEVDTDVNKENNFYTMDSEDMDLDDQSAAETYRNAISSVGRSAKQSSQSTKQKGVPTPKTKSSALIEEEEFIDSDWLVNDLKPTKQKKVDVSGYLSTGNIRKRSRSGSISPDPRFEKRKSCSSNQKKRLRVVDSDSDSDETVDFASVYHKRVNSELKGTNGAYSSNGYDVGLTVSDDHLDTDLNGSLHNVSIHSIPDIHDIDIMFTDDQIDFINEHNLNDSNSNLPSQHVIATPAHPVPSQQKFKKSAQKQLKLTKFITNSDHMHPQTQNLEITQSSKNRLSNESENGIKSQNGNIDTQSTIVLTSVVNRDTAAVNSVIKVKVKVDQIVLIIPVIDIDGTKTFEWLADEAARRYYKMKGVKLKLSLGKDGAHFSPEDLVSLMISDNDTVDSFIDSKDEQPPMVESYKNACQALKTVCYKNISSLLQACEISGKLQLADLALKSQRFLPVIRAFQHQTCLRDLDIRGNRIGDVGLENLCKMLHTVPNLAALCLACNDITTHGLNTLVAGISDSKSLQLLSSLDISYNPLYDESLLCVAGLIKELPKLTSLKMSSCKLTTKFFHSNRLQLTEALHGSSVQHLDISYNQIGCVGVELFLKCQNPSQLLTLDLSGTVTDARSSQLYRHLYNYTSQDNCSLQQLTLTQCNLGMDDVDFLVRLPAVCKNLQKLNISENSKLTNAVLHQIFQASANESSNLDEIVANQCGVHSPLSVEFLDFLSEKLSSRIPLRVLEFSCFKLEKLDTDSLQQVWTEKYEGFAQVVIDGSHVKLTVSDHFK